MRNGPEAGAGLGRLVVVLYGAVSDSAAPDNQDTLLQMHAISATLRQVGWRVSPLAMTLRLDELQRRLTDLGPHLVFNLVEAVDGHDALLSLAPVALEALGLAFTGTPAAGMICTSNKLDAKRIMRQSGIPTPQTWLPGQSPGDEPDRARWIVKAVWEHASFGLDDAAVVSGADAVRQALRQRTAHLGGQWFAERYIPGREFNLSLLEGPGGPQVLPAAEIRFVDFPADKPHIVGYAAKWHPDSVEYQGTVRSFDLPRQDAPLVADLDAIARRCWDVFGLRGYARVDFRVDERGTPWVLEVNANPCLSPDAGFAAAAERAGIAYAGLVERIVQAALSPPAAHAGHVPAETPPSPPRPSRGSATAPRARRRPGKASVRLR